MGKFVDLDYEWINENYDNYKTIKELLDAYNEEHGTNITRPGFGYHLNSKMKKTKLYRFSDEEKEFIREKYPLMPTDEFLDLYEERFGWKPAGHRMNCYAHSIGVKKTADVRFKIRQHQTMRPLGTEFTGVRGGQINRLVKVAETGVWRFDWKPKQFIVWEEAHGPIPEKHAIVFLDGDTTNCDLENLACIPKRHLAMMNKIFKFGDNNPQTKALKIEWCKLHDALLGKEDKDG